MLKIKLLSQKFAQQLDKELMATASQKEGGFFIQQLMELAGLSVAEAVYKSYPPKKFPRILICCGPGNNGGDGLVAARHLSHFGYSPIVYYPKENKNELFQGLVTQLNHLLIPVVTDFEKSLASEPSVFLDAIFGFSFSGSVRPPFQEALKCFLMETRPIVAVDVPSGWPIDEEPKLIIKNETTDSNKQDIDKYNYTPSMLISLSAPKYCSKYFDGPHYLGGRFIPKTLALKYEIQDLPPYSGAEQSTLLCKTLSEAIFID